MHVIHIGAECYPVAKIGGLGDVLGALPKYLSKKGIHTQVVLPWYDNVFTKEQNFDLVFQSNIKQGSRALEMQVFKEKKQLLGFELFLIKIPGLIDRPEVYSYDDESEQFMAFQQAFLHWLVQENIQPDIVHCHDHHTGLIPFLMYHGNDFKALSHIKTVATVHNAQYQGWMDWNKAILLPSFDTWKWGLLDWAGNINPLATMIKCCSAYTAVSEGYLQELFLQANQLESLFYAEKEKAYGIVNGIDSDIWNTETDEMIAVHYNKIQVTKGKTENKKELLSAYDIIDYQAPLLAFIGRFAEEKGADLLPIIIKNIVQNLDMKVNIFILGSGNKAIEQEIKAISSHYKDNCASHIGYKEKLAHQIYAAADFILMPSRVEPCGLNQLYAMKYGTLPLVHATGGLKDTVRDLADQNGTGIHFNSLSYMAIQNAIERAISVFDNKKELLQTRRRMMKQDFSWEQSAEKYIQLYHKLIS